MKIAITASENGWDEQVDSRFGRARGFFVIDTDDGTTSFIDNDANVDAAHGAGTSAAKSVIDAGVQVVISGDVGPKAATVLEAGGVQIMRGVKDVSIKEAYESYQKGDLV
jgi:predicted Fe-Mo cluster-binding NifX family protein